MLMQCGVIGDPAEHSLSPAIHRAGYEAVGLPWTYSAYTVAPADLDAFIQARRADPQWAGLSVTAPHKEAILPYGSQDEATRIVGAGNTLVFGEQTQVFNTDVDGFVRAWREHDLSDPGRAAVIGNGATARSIVLALAHLGAHEIVVVARRPERSGPLVDLAATLGLSAQSVALGDSIDAVGLLASTVPAAALDAHAVSLTGQARCVFDVVYDPWPTPLTARAEEQGIPVLNGLDLLAGQAVKQFRLFTGHEVSFAQCRSAAGRELKRRSAL